MNDSSYIQCRNPLLCYLLKILFSRGQNKGSHIVQWLLWDEMVSGLGGRALSALYKRSLEKQSTWGWLHPTLCVKEENSPRSLGFPAEGRFSFSLELDTQTDSSGHSKRKQFLSAQNPSGLNCKEQLHHLFIGIVFCQACFIHSPPVPLLVTEENTA